MKRKQGDRFLTKCGGTASTSAFSIELNHRYLFLRTYKGPNSQTFPAETTTLCVCVCVCVCVSVGKDFRENLFQKNDSTENRTRFRQSESNDVTTRS